MKRKILILFVIPMVGLLSWQCTFKDDIDRLKDAADSLQLVVNTPKFESALHLDIVDAKTGKILLNQRVDVEFRKSNQDKALLSNVGKYEGNYDVRLGFLDLAVNPDLKLELFEDPDKRPYTDVVVRSEGYLTTTKRLFLHGGKFQTEVLTMTNLDDTPTGVETSRKNDFLTLDDSGKSRNSSTHSMNQNEQTLSIPKDAIFKDKNGKLLTGKIDSRIVFYDPNSEEAQQAFPGGTSTAIKTEAGEHKKAELIPVGTFAINLTAADNREIHTVSDGFMTLKTTLPDNFINPTTDKPAMEGEIISLWSREDESGEWVEEGKTTIKTNDGRLVLEKDIDHLTCWTWAWAVDACNNPAKLVFKGDAASCFVALKYSLENNGYTHQMNYFVNTDNDDFNHISLYKIPQASKANFTLEGIGVNGEKLTFEPATFSLGNLCQGVVKDIKVSVAKSANDITANFDLSYTSQDKKIIVRPNATAYIFQNDMYGSRGRLNLQNGKATMNVSLNKEYSFYGYYGRVYGAASFIINKISDKKATVTVLPFMIYDGNSGSSNNPKKMSYDVDIEDGNMINIKYDAVLTDAQIDKIETF